MAGRPMLRYLVRLRDSRVVRGEDVAVTGARQTIELALVCLALLLALVRALVLALDDLGPECLVSDRPDLGGPVGDRSRGSQRGAEVPIRTRDGAADLRAG